jgi:hypothetical protein
MSSFEMPYAPCIWFMRRSAERPVALSKPCSTMASSSSPVSA